MVHVSVAPVFALALAALIAGVAGASAEQKSKSVPAPAPATKNAPAAKGQEQQQPQVQQAIAIPTPWTKICNADPNTKKEICLVSQEIRAETGQFLASVALREIQDDPKKLFIIAVPPGMQLQPGMRVVIDQHEPMPARYSICFPNACYGDMEITNDFISMMKKGQGLTIQAINQVGRTVNFTLALKEFAKAYDGPAIDPKVVEQQQRKLQEELQKRADEQRKKLESQTK